MAESSAASKPRDHPQSDAASGEAGSGRARISDSMVRLRSAQEKRIWRGPGSGARLNACKGGVDYLSAVGVDWQADRGLRGVGSRLRRPHRDVERPVQVPRISGRTGFGTESEPDFHARVMPAVGAFAHTRTIVPADCARRRRRRSEPDPPRQRICAARSDSIAPALGCRHACHRPPQASWSVRETGIRLRNGSPLERRRYQRTVDVDEELGHAKSGMVIVA